MGLTFDYYNSDNNSTNPSVYEKPSSCVNQLNYQQQKKKQKQKQKRSPKQRLTLDNVFEVYRKPRYDETIQKMETRTYYPYIKSFNNNDVIEISINQRDSWVLMHEAAIVIEGELRRDGGEGEVSLVNNAGAFMFDNITYELNGKEVDSVRTPGIVSTIRGYLCYNQMDSNILSTAGWCYPNNLVTTKNKSTFVLRIPLHHLFGLFIDYKLAQFGKHTLRLVRARSDLDAIVCKSLKDTAPTSGIIKMTNICLKAPIVVPNDMLKIKLLDSIKNDKPILLPFRRWEYHELPQLTTGSTKEIWGVKTCTAVESPRFVIVAFQSDKRENDSVDTTVFDNMHASEVRVVLNCEYYPAERQGLNFAKHSYTESHYNYTQFFNNFKHDASQVKQPLLDYSTFKDNTIFVIDCSKRNTALKLGTIDVKLEIESRVAFPQKTKAYCVIVHDCVLEYLPLSEIVRTVT
ncbi:uncharacterized protein LOC126264368 [Aethina tumida]|uniref:uncharacterized protein LOC126264368 n=1 Tax=Aethina tumida TaxID=116153 RepID=UPI0021498CE6|nr:uncharacterized protein LOC126264368 [Aethina tumida]